MVALGLLLIAAGVLAVLGALFASEGQAEYLGFDLSSMAIFLLGAAAGACVLWGFGILKYGTKRGIQTRRERKELRELNAKLEKVEQERQTDGDPDRRP